MSEDGIVEVSVSHGQLEVILKGPAEAVSSVTQIDVASHPFDGRADARTVAEAIEGPFHPQVFSKGGEETHWEQADRPQHEAYEGTPMPHLEVVVYQ